MSSTGTIGGILVTTYLVCMRRLSFPNARAQVAAMVSVQIMASSSVLDSMLVFFRFRASWMVVGVSLNVTNRVDLRPLLL